MAISRDESVQFAVLPTLKLPVAAAEKPLLLRGASNFVIMDPLPIQQTNRSGRFAAAAFAMFHKRLTVPVGAEHQAQLGKTSQEVSEHVRQVTTCLQHIGRSFQNKARPRAQAPRPRIRQGHTAIDNAKQLLAGALSAAISRTMIAPLERVKLELLLGTMAANAALKDRAMVVATEVLTKEGFGGFWKGNGLNLLRITPFKAINFYCFDAFHRALCKQSGRTEMTNTERACAGAAAGISATLLCFPLDTLRTRMLAESGSAYTSVFSCISHMVQHEGVGSLYRGVMPAIIAMAPSGAVFYGVYDVLKQSHLRAMHNKGIYVTHGQGALEIGAGPTLLYGAIAGLCAELATYPMEVVRRQLQLQGTMVCGKRVAQQSALLTARSIIQSGGVQSLYAGVLPSALQVLPSAALSYYFYELFKSVLNVG
eukprot:jgi/Chlat1/3578/Chrsp234S03567